MEEETKFQVYDLGGEELPEFKITKLSQEEISQLGEEELAKYTLKAETTLTKAYSI